MLLNITQNEELLKSIEIKESKPEIKINTPFITSEKAPALYSEEDIINLLQKKLDLTDEFKYYMSLNYYMYNTCIEKVKKDLNAKKDKRIRTNKIIKEKEEKNFLGRKKKDDVSIRTHNKYSSDNIICKIKTTIKKHLINFINNIIHFTYTEREIEQILNKLNLPQNRSSSIIKDIDYKSLVNIKSKKDNLFLLKLSINEFLSQNVSTRYRTFNKDYEEYSHINKSIIESFINDKEKQDLFQFVFNQINIGDFMDIFIYQKELNDFPFFNSLNEYKQMIIKKSLIRIEVIFQEIKDEISYFFCFIFLIYNYRRYYLIKQERKRKKSFDDDNEN